MRENRTRRTEARGLSAERRRRRNFQRAAAAVLFPVVLACALAFARAGRRGRGPRRDSGGGTSGERRRPLAPVEREVKGGESHSYSVSLSSGQFLHALVEQKGMDVEVTVYGPDGRQLSASDSPNDLWGPEPISRSPRRRAPTA